jgi:hypothetical protein
MSKDQVNEQKQTDGKKKGSPSGGGSAPVSASASEQKGVTPGPLKERSAEWREFLELVRSRLAD